MNHEEIFPARVFRVRNAKSAGFNSDGEPIVIRVSDPIFKQDRVVGNYDHIMNHMGIKSGTFSDDLTSEWYDKKCRIYESNRNESPNLDDENAGKIQT